MSTGVWFIEVRGFEAMEVKVDWSDMVQHRWGSYRFYPQSADQVEDWPSTR